MRERFIIIEQRKPLHFDTKNGPMKFEVVDRGENFVVGGQSADNVIARFAILHDAEHLVSLLLNLRERS